LITVEMVQCHCHWLSCSWAAAVHTTTTTTLIATWRPHRKCQSPAARWLLGLAQFPLRGVISVILRHVSAVMRITLMTRYRQFCAN